MFCSVLFMKMQLYTLCILDIFFLSYVLNNNPHITCRFCKIKATLNVGRQVIKGGFVNLCTSFCSFNPFNASVRAALTFNGLSLSRENIWILLTRGLNNIWVLITPETTNTSLMPGKLQSPSHGKLNRSSVLVGNNLEIVPQ